MKHLDKIIFQRVGVEVCVIGSYGKMSSFKRLMRLLGKVRTTGQINESSEIGRWILFLSSLSTVSTVVDIGSWNGRGSTRLATQGLRKGRSSKAPKLVGLEVDKSRADQAKRLFRRETFVEIIWGSIVNSDELDTENLTEAENEWLRQDVDRIDNSPLIPLASIPEAIDLLILDGGEFSTMGEWMKLKSYVKHFVVLDDTSTRKSEEILQSVVSGAETGFSLIFKSEERNGVAVLARK